MIDFTLEQLKRDFLLFTNRLGREAISYRPDMTDEEWLQFCLQNQYNQVTFRNDTIY